MKGILMTMLPVHVKGALSQNSNLSWLDNNVKVLALQQEQCQWAAVQNRGTRHLA